MPIPISALLVREEDKIWAHRMSTSSVAFRRGDAHARAPLSRPPESDHLRDHRRRHTGDDRDTRGHYAAHRSLARASRAGESELHALRLYREPFAVHHSDHCNRRMVPSQRGTAHSPARLLAHDSPFSFHWDSRSTYFSLGGSSVIRTLARLSGFTLLPSAGRFR